MDELNALPYLDMVLKETLRHHSPVPSTSRIAMHDDVIPVEKPFMDKKGRMCDHITYVLSFYHTRCVLNRALTA